MIRILAVTFVDEILPLYVEARDPERFIEVALGSELNILLDREVLNPDAKFLMTRKGLIKLN